MIRAADGAARAAALANERLTGIRPAWGVMMVGVWVCTVVMICVGAALNQPVFAFGPIVAFMLLVGIGHAKVRTTLLTLIFFALVLENPSEKPLQGVREIFYPAGALLLSNLNNTIPIKALRFSGMDVFTVLLFGLLAYRRVMGIHDDKHEQVPTAKPLVVAMLLSMGAVLALMLFGLARGGSFQNSLWQCQKLFYVPLFGLLMSVALRGPSDHGVIGRLVVIAGLCKAVMAIYLRAKLGPDVPFVTSHVDSMLFAMAFTIPMTRLLIAADKKSFKMCLFILPILAWGMVANQRRLVWVEVAAVAMMVLMLTPRTAVKRALVRALVLSIPLWPVYIAAGWNSPSKLFKPVQTLRSIADSKSDRSTETRDIENYNLTSTLKNHPILGTGFGHEYEEFVAADDISYAFPQYRFIPHNSVLGLWAFTGVVGFTALWLFLGVGVYFAARAYRWSTTIADKTAALTCIAGVIIYLVQAYGDMGVVSWLGVFIVAPSVVLAAKLAVATGAWPRRAPQPQAVPVPLMRPLQPVEGGAA